MKGDINRKDKYIDKLKEQIEELEKKIEQQKKEYAKINEKL